MNLNIKKIIIIPFNANLFAPQTTNKQTNISLKLGFSQSDFYLCQKCKKKIKPEVVE